jgi:hypothetical protein
LAGGLVTSAGRDQINVLSRLGDRRAGTGIHHVPKPDNPAQIRILLDHRLSDGSGFGLIPVGRLTGDDFDIVATLQRIRDGIQLINAGSRGGGSLDDRNFTALASFRAALLDHSVRCILPNSVPIGTDERIGLVTGLHIDVHHLDAGFFGTFEQAGIGRHVEVLHQNDVRLFGNSLGNGPRAGIGAPIGIANVEVVAEAAPLLSA